MRKFFLAIIAICIISVLSVSALAERTVIESNDFAVTEASVESSASIAAYVGSLTGSGSNSDFNSSGTFRITANGESGYNDYLRINSYTADGASTVLIKLYLGTSTSGNAIAYDVLPVTSSDKYIAVAHHSNGNSNVTDTCTYTVQYSVAGGSAIVNAQFVQR